jgi:hypothetical protein
MSHRALLRTIVPALWILGSACSTSTPGGGGSGGTTAKGGSGGSKSGGSQSGGASGNGGSPASGGSSGSTTQPVQCPNGTSCGGSVVGTWNVTSSCLTLSGNMDVSILGMGCSSVPITGSLDVTGTWTANADGTYADNTVTKGSIKFPLSNACLTVSSVLTECSKMASLFPSPRLEHHDHVLKR